MVAGMSLETAIELDCVANGVVGIKKEKEWVELHFPGYRMTFQELIPVDDRIYDALTIKKDDDEHIVYFHITDWYGIFEPIDLPPECAKNAT